MSIHDYDKFLIDLSDRIKAAPNRRAQIIRNAVDQTGCPYLKSKILELKQGATVSIFFLLLLLSFTSIAQSSHTVLEKKSNQPILGATVQIQSASNSVLTITDVEGKFVVPFEPPYQLVINHVGFRSFTQSVSDDSIETYYLSTSTQNLEEVVVTGQFEPQSARQSVYSVRTIDNLRLEAQAANSLQDVLANELNIRFSRDNALGSSRISLQGLSGQNVKILLDGVPITGRSGTANEVDLGQINVQSIDRIEIVEGPLAVNYGADALAGVINIITNKEPAKLKLNLNLQEETVGSEYSFFENGIHNASVQLGGSISSYWFIQGEARVNRYGGWIGTGDERNKSWYPKNQLFGGGLVRYQKGDFDVYYRVDYLDEVIQNLGEILDNNSLKDPFALDEEYLSGRWMHQFQSTYSTSHLAWNAVLSFTDYSRNTHQFSTNLVTNDETTTIDSEQDTIFYQAFFQRQTISSRKPYALGVFSLTGQVGVDTDIETAGGSTLSEGDKTQSNVGFFGSAEFSVSKLKLRPGIRFTYNSAFQTIPTPSLNMKYDWSDQLILRIGYGRGYRAPSIRELYHEFIDANHNILGNQDLQSERAHNVSGELSYQPQERLTWRLSGFFNHIDNQITYAIPAEANQPTSYINLLQYKTAGGSIQTTWKQDQLNIATGFSYIGLYQRLSESETEVAKFLFSPNANLNIKYQFKNGINLSSFYTFTGASKNYQLDEEGNAVLGRVNAFSFLDLTASKKINDFSLSLGVRNLLDVTSVNNNISGGGAHSGSSSGQTPIAYGRSFFFRLNYQLIKQTQL